MKIHICHSLTSPYLKMVNRICYHFIKLLTWENPLTVYWTSQFDSWLISTCMIYCISHWRWVVPCYMTDRNMEGKCHLIWQTSTWEGSAILYDRQKHERKCHLIWQTETWKEVPSYMTDRNIKTSFILYDRQKTMSTIRWHSFPSRKTCQL